MIYNACAHAYLSVLFTTHNIMHDNQHSGKKIARCSLQHNLNKLSTMYTYGDVLLLKRLLKNKK